MNNPDTSEKRDVLNRLESSMNPISVVKRYGGLTCAYLTGGSHYPHLTPTFFLISLLLVLY